MCGIAGIFGKPDHATVGTMLSALRHRGPDGNKVMADGKAAFGHARLSIIDLSPAAAQPMASDDGQVWLTYNGEIYNFRELRRTLEGEGVRFRTSSDTEVILALYVRYGDGFLRRLRGIFAFALYDKRGGPGRERLLLARDPIGVKPLLYARQSDGLVFASELKAMVPVLDNIGVDLVSLRQLLAWGSVCQPRTILSGVSMLPPGHFLVAQANVIHSEAYWSPGIDRVSCLRDQPYAELLSAAEEKVTETLTAQLVADVPVGAFLSGGINSSLLVALMARRANNAVLTYSVGFENAVEVEDETDDAAEVAAFLGTAHHRVVVTGTDAAENIRAIARDLDQPTVDGINSWFVSRAVGGELKVAISGTGGDELFAGYPWYSAMKAWDDSAARPLTQLKSLAKRLLRGEGREDFVSAYSRHYRIFGPEQAVTMLAPDLIAPAGNAVGDLGDSDCLREGTALERTTALCLGNYTKNQLLRDIDVASMAHGLEVRVPLLDHELVDFALSLPDDAKLRPNSVAGSSYESAGLKRILVDVGRKYLPPGFTHRRKRGFTLPFMEWLRGPLASTLEDCLSPDSVVRRGLFAPAAIGNALTQFKSGIGSWPQVWLLMMTELWCREVLDGR